MNPKGCQTTSELESILPDMKFWNASQNVLLKRIDRFWDTPRSKVDRILAPGRSQIWRSFYFTSSRNRLWQPKQVQNLSGVFQFQKIQKIQWRTKRNGRSIDGYIESLIKIELLVITYFIVICTLLISFYLSARLHPTAVTPWTDPAPKLCRKSLNPSPSLVTFLTSLFISLTTNWTETKTATCKLSLLVK